jgi:hypothetical protein
LTKSVEYRPLLDVGTRLAYRIIGLNLGTYKAIVGLEFALILAAFVFLFRPVGWRQGVAATVTLSVAVGLHTSQILFLFVPLNAYAASMLIVLGVVLLVLSPRLRGREWVLLPLTLVALLWLEVGILIVPIVGIAWLMKAPGTTWRGVAASLVGVTMYLVARLGFGPTMGLTSPDTGLGFSTISPADSAALFAHVPWLFWLHNVGVTLMSVLASEPRAGRFQFIGALLSGSVPLWMWLHVLSSVATTALVCAMLIRVRSRSHREQLIVAIGGVLVLGGSALGFLYTRDRIGLPVGFGYAMLVYVTVRAALEEQGARWRAVVVGTLVTVLGICWSIRTVELSVALRDTAWDYHSEWERPEALDAEFESPIVARMRATALKHRPADPRRDPAWTYALFERRFEPVTEEREP